MYPFLFWNQTTNKFHVIIADPFDYINYNSQWMNDDKMRNVWVPDVDLEKSNNIFDSEKDALIFIRQWWIDNPVL